MAAENPSVMDLSEMEKRAGQASELLKCLAHPARLMIVCQLVNGERSVSELVNAVGQSQSSVSQHLSRMRNERIVTTRRESQTIYYSLKDHRAREIVGVVYELYCR